MGTGDDEAEESGRSPEPRGEDEAEESGRSQESRGEDEAEEMRQEPRRGGRAGRGRRASGNEGPEEGWITSK